MALFYYLQKYIFQAIFIKSIIRIKVFLLSLICPRSEEESL